MIYNIRGDKILVTDSIKEYITEKLDRLNAKYGEPEKIQTKSNGQKRSNGISR